MARLDLLRVHAATRRQTTRDRICAGLVRPAWTVRAGARANPRSPPRLAARL